MNKKNRETKEKYNGKESKKFFGIGHGKPPKMKLLKHMNPLGKV